MKRPWSAAAAAANVTREHLDRDSPESPDLASDLLHYSIIFKLYTVTCDCQAAADSDSESEQSTSGRARGARASAP